LSAQPNSPFPAAPTTRASGSGSPSSWTTGPVPPIVLAIVWSAVIGGLTYLLARPFLPPIPQARDATEASDAVVATVLIPGVVHSLIASIAFLIVALLMAWFSGRQIERKSGRAVFRQRGLIRIGLGDRPLGAPGLLLGAILLVVVYAVFLSDLQFRNIDDFFGAVFRAGSGWRLAAFLVFGLLAPVAEEMMFRGWLWTSLRQSWPGFACTLVTGLLWLLTHFSEGSTKMAILAPVALLLGLMRQQSASLRAPILLHLALNFTGLTAPFVLRALGIA
jgi:membrane protease YdiL (CAAX protease family)